MSQQPTLPFMRVVRAFEEFVSSQAFSGVLLVICTLIALVWANSHYGHFYDALNQTKVGFSVGSFGLYKSVKHWVNDGLMAIFFLLVGLEIKREILVGELSSWRRALLPVVAALGGMLVPAIIFALLNHHDPGALKGWAIPMATDIAFALGILSLLGKLVPRSLFVLLSAIAIVDDLGAVIVIAAFYGHGLNWLYLGCAAVCLCILIGFNVLGVRKLSPYLLIGLVLWFFIFKSGVHATIAGVLLAFTIPARLGHTDMTVGEDLKQLLQQFLTVQGSGPVGQGTRAAILQAIEGVLHVLETPLQRLEHALHYPVTYLIIPIFVLLNAGVHLAAGSGVWLILLQTLTLGIILGLILGKVIGIFGASFIVVKMRWVRLSDDVSLQQILPLSLIAAIGFTMSIFVSELAYTSGQQIMMAKIGILVASLIAACLGYILMRFMCRGDKVLKTEK